jgi:predicted ATPase
LAPLSRRSSRDLTEALLARLEKAPAALRDLVTTSAEGNPYFVEELIGMMMDDGVIVADGERWRRTSSGFCAIATSGAATKLVVIASMNIRRSISNVLASGG